MSAETWKLCPATRNAVERKNMDCKENRPLPLKVAIANAYRLDKAVCFRHLASLRGTCTSIAHQSKTAESQATEAGHRKEERRKRSHQDSDAQYGPPDKSLVRHTGSRAIRLRQGPGPVLNAQLSISYLLLFAPGGQLINYS